MDLIQTLAGIGGIGGVLAYLIFLAYKYLVRQMREDRKYMEDRLTGIIAEYNSTCRANQKASNKSTRVMTELITWLKAKNGSK